MPILFWLPALLWWAGGAWQPARAGDLPGEATEGSGAAESLPQSGRTVLPSRPENHILDEARMLPEALHREWSGKLQASAGRAGLGVYVAIHTYLLQETADQRARALHQAWLEGQVPGIVVVHDRSTGRLSFAGSDDPRMPDPEKLREIYRRSDSLAKGLPPTSNARDRLLVTVESLAESLEYWAQHRQVPPGLEPPGAKAMVGAEPLSFRPSASGLEKVADDAGSPDRTSEGFLPRAGSGSEGSEDHRAEGGFAWLPGRPAQLLLDDAGVFRDPDAARAIRTTLMQARQKYGLELYVVTVTYPVAAAGPSPAAALAQEWLKDSVGGVIWYDRSRPAQLSFAGPPHVSRWLSPVQLETVHAEALAAADQAGADPAVRIQAAANSLLTSYVGKGLPMLEESRMWVPSAQRMVLPWVWGAFGLVALLLWMVKRRQDRSDFRRGTVFVFPEVYVPNRLGAPHGGGACAEISGKTVSGSAPSQ